MSDESNEQPEADPNLNVDAPSSDEAASDIPKPILEALRLIAGGGEVRGLRTNSGVLFGTRESIEAFIAAEKNAAARLLGVEVEFSDDLIDFLGDLNGNQLRFLLAILRSVEQDPHEGIRINGMVQLLLRERDRAERAVHESLHENLITDPRVDPDQPRGTFGTPEHIVQDAGGVRTPKEGENVDPLTDAPGAGDAAIGSSDPTDGVDLVSEGHALADRLLGESKPKPKPKDKDDGPQGS